MEEESIYNILPREYDQPSKNRRYKSRFPSTIAPTGSTFNNKTTSRPNVKK